MAITSIHPTEWVTLTFRVPAEVHRQILEYGNLSGSGFFTPISQTIRELVALGLNSDRAIDQTIRANAEAKAFYQLSDALDEAVTKFRAAREE